MKRPDITPAFKKKQKIYITAIKTKKKGTFTLIIIEEIKSEKDSDSVYGPEND